jgi:hypothetical protein
MIMEVNTTVQEFQAQVEFCIAVQGIEKGLHFRSARAMAEAGDCHKLTKYVSVC